MPALFTNNAATTVASALSNVATSLTVASGKGALFPVITGTDFFLLTLTQSGTETTWEIVKVTARSSDVLTIVRAQEGTTAAAWAVGDKAELRITASTLLGFSIDTPSNVSPAQGASGINHDVPLTGSAFSSALASAQSAIQVQVSTSSSFANPLYSSGDQAAGSSFVLPYNIGIVVSTLHFYRLRYKNARGSYSDWSDPTSFTTAAVFASKPTTIEYLIVAAGGGGGSDTAASTAYELGGGGAGGFLTASGFAVASGVALTVTVGSGGSGGGYSGNNSIFSTITSTGGGGGGTKTGNTPTEYLGKNGGSGGGAAGTQTAGTGISGQGNSGGNQNTATSQRPAGGGGGAGAAGGNGTNTNGIAGGVGGVGLASSITGSSVFYAGGGGGGSGALGSGAGGNGGGGAGGAQTIASVAVSGTANTGGGGGGGIYYQGVGGAGGSGVVIIRYLSTYDVAYSTTGSPTVTVTGGYRIYRWTGNGSITF